MITRGIIIGKIVDDIASLKYQIELRNKLKIFDLSKICEDFCKDVLNILYKLNLKNLNNTRSNNPGLDLGDTKTKIAYQITSTRSSKKIIDTLISITGKQLDSYEKFYIFILGKKMKSPKIDNNLLKKFAFETAQNIKDFDDLLKDIMVAEMDVLDALYTLFSKEFRKIKIELEPVDKNGNYESSLYNNIEQIPNKIPTNAGKLAKLFADEYENTELNYEAVVDLYHKLSKIPRITRELIPIIAERGKRKRFNRLEGEYGILPQSLKHISRFTNEELENELEILLDADIVYIGDNFVGDAEKLSEFIVLNGEPLIKIISWSLAENISLRTLFNTMDWTIFDSEGSVS